MAGAVTPAHWWLGLWLVLMVAAVWVVISVAGPMGLLLCWLLIGIGANLARALDHVTRETAPPAVDVRKSAE